MNDRITENFLKGNLFECPGQVAGWPHWYYTEKNKFEVVICPQRGKISCVNYDTGEEIQFSSRKIFLCTKTQLRKCLEFIGIKDEFDYTL